MTNKFHGNNPQLEPKAKAPRTAKSGPKVAARVAAANWPGLPGATQPRDRSQGVSRAKIHTQSKGL